MLPLVILLAALGLASFVAGIAGSYLGIGGGILLIPFMTLLLQVDIRVAVAVSLAGVIVPGVFAGTRLGTRWMVRAKAGRVRVIFAILLADMAVFMILRSFLPRVNF